MSSRKIVITGGGTAGHTNPGIAVAEALVARGWPREAVHFVGGKRGNESTLVPAAGFSIDLLSGRGIERKISARSVTAVLGLVAGLGQGFWYVLTKRPAAVLCLGGYAAFAVSMAAVLLRVPVVVTEQNARASAVNRLIGRWTRVNALPFPDTDLPNGELTGNPTLAAVVDAVRAAERDEARRQLDLPLDRVVVAVWSGSLGAASVNRATRALAARWADRGDVSIRHVVGRRDWPDYQNPPESVATAADGLHYQLIEYENQMPLLLTAADLAICRSGASTVAELAIAGLPTVLVPLPGAPRDHQTANSAELVEAGGAVLVPDGELSPERLASELEPLLVDADRRAVMRAAAASVARPDAALAVADLLLDAAGAAPAVEAAS
ncbi:MAG: UDP-N-acetylglucosamine--N-acetylmuramyl-(pentapeptide) pyrophosphoryl-undecaprenol N-acetylglucosamine transferase [Actinomycetota bacterium]